MEENAPAHIHGPDWSRCDSVQRPRAMINWVLEHIKKRTPNHDVGPVFWEILWEWWPSFDLIEHDMFAMAFVRYRPYWTPQPEFSRLPERFTVWRGGDRYRVRKGLCWTLDQSVAEGFARGHRFIFNKYPTLLMAEIERSEVAMVNNHREESEVVLWKPLWERAQRISLRPTNRVVEEGERGCP